MKDLNVNSEKKPVAIRDFPTHVWNVFVGQCHARGRTVAAVLEDIVRNWLKEQADRGY